ncbi:MAG: NAD(P)H-dependent glycerol-3-phosphate dehydrogenase [Microscillaceae bacterium]|nr:NAD(P)H-dependent glycerol-3-phosphate dehydrogenase [Microscillaceae bacterium]
MKNLSFKNLKKRRWAEPSPATVSIIGGGSWATALVKILSENHVRIRWWLRDKNAVRHIRKHRHNPDYLSGVQIPRRRVKTFSNLSEAIADSEYVLIVVPAAFVKDALRDLKSSDFQQKTIVSAVKGIVPDAHQLVTEMIAQEYGVAPETMCVIAGPCHAEEVALEKQSYLTISSPNAALATRFSQLLNCRYIRTSISTDLYGIEYAAVMKNITALACGITHGLNYGDNFQAVLVSNAAQEIHHFLEKVAPHPQRNLNASAYLGDLLVTAYSQFSRNRTFGNMIGRGYSVKSAQMEMNMVAEGYYAVRSIHEINKNFQVNLPIAEAVYRILYERSPPDVEIARLRDVLH